MASKGFLHLTNTNMILLRMMCCMALVSMTSVGGSEYCAHYSFETPFSGRDVDIDEHTELNLRFRLANITDHCPGNKSQKTRIYISHPSQKEPTDPDFCIFSVTANGKCIVDVNKKNCECDLNQTWSFVLKTNVTQSDSGVWIWKHWKNIMAKAEKTLNVKYPPKVKHLTFKITNRDVTGKYMFVDRGTHLLIECTWEKGNPNSLDPHDVRLLDWQGNELSEVTASNNALTAQLFADCANNGNITCYVPGASENKTAFLRVGGCFTRGPPTTITPPPDPDHDWIIIICITAALILCVFGCLSKYVIKKVSGNRPHIALPSAPSSVRQPAPDVVLFRRDLPGRPSVRSSFGSESAHDYNEIEEDLQQNSTRDIKVFHRSVDSTTWNGQYLDHIAFPSSESSVSEYGESALSAQGGPSSEVSSDYLHPIASQQEVATAY